MLFQKYFYLFSGLMVQGALALSYASDPGDISQELNPSKKRSDSSSFPSQEAKRPKVEPDGISMGNRFYHLETTSIEMKGEKGLRSLSPSLTMLPYLRMLKIEDCKLAGDIPDSFRTLQALKDLSFSSNALTGPIPMWLGELSQLTSIFLSYNQLSGPIPNTLGNLRGLTCLGLNSNHLTGPIPENLGNLSLLERLELEDNDLSGTIPASLGNLAYLRHLDVGGNKLTGPIPASLGALSFLKTLQLNENKLTGDVPNTLAHLRDLEILDVSDNYLAGVPAAILKMSLHSLNLDHTYFSIIDDTEEPIEITAGQAILGMGGSNCDPYIPSKVIANPDSEVKIYFYNLPNQHLLFPLQGCCLILRGPEMTIEGTMFHPADGRAE